MQYIILFIAVLSTAYVEKEFGIDKPLLYAIGLTTGLVLGNFFDKGDDNNKRH